VHLNVGFVGLGAMGYPMAKNLAIHHAHHPDPSSPVLVWNRSPAATQKLQEELGSKVKIAESLEQIVAECDLIFTSIGSDDGVKEVYSVFANTLQVCRFNRLTDLHAIICHSTLHITRPKSLPKLRRYSPLSPVSSPWLSRLSSTLMKPHPRPTAELDALLSQIPHTHFVASPVFGPPIAAQKAQLTLVLSGDYRSKKTVAYVAVPAFGRKVIDLGGNIEKGARTSQIGQYTTNLHHSSAYL
jgi:3-hydroxyisobutyrate dehydrogenase-like beta-hydroxyacid dehydrogenase